MTENKPTAPPQYAVWFFIVATFVVATPVTVFRGAAESWVTILSLVGGMLLVVLGGIQLGREIGARRAGPPFKR